MTYIAPAGTPISLRDLSSSARRAAHGADPAQELSAVLARIAATSRCWPVSSGRAALTLILQAMHAGRRDRDVVVVPAYTCFSVPASVARAGLRVQVCDVDPRTLGLDPAALERLDFGRVLAVLSANLYGLPNSLPELEEIARVQGVFMIDDAAQALGATIAGRPAGSFGDAGLFSFDKGKIISTIQGGAIVARDGEVAAELDRQMPTLSGPRFLESVALSAKLAAYAAFLRPGLYGFISRMPFLGLGRNDFEMRFPITRLGRFQSAMALTLVSRLRELNERRRINASRLATELAAIPGIRIPAVSSGAEPVFARYPICAPDRPRRDLLVRRLNEAGIGASRSYESAILDHAAIASILVDVQPCPGAREIAATLLTIPTHAYCPPDFGARVSEIIRKEAA